MVDATLIPSFRTVAGMAPAAGVAALRKKEDSMVTIALTIALLVVIYRVTR